MYRASVACLQETKCAAGVDDTTGLTPLWTRFCNSLETVQQNTHILEGVGPSFSPTADSVCDILMQNVDRQSTLSNSTVFQHAARYKSTLTGYQKDLWRTRPNLQPDRLCPM